MSLCAFCSKELEKGTGKKYIKGDGKIMHFCSSKCEKNMIKLGRKSRKMKWAKPAKK